MTAALQTNELVQFRFDSSQRKNNVLIYDSQRFPGKSSEWYFVRRNQTSKNETYRCVHCRATRERTRRSNHLTSVADVVSNPGARIIVCGNFFTISPDFPLGVHICDFEINENCNTHAVWSRRALLRANSELRLNPEKPKLKFAKLLQSIENGEDEYAHLSTDTRMLIVQQLTSKNGFDSRRRSFARNNSFGFKRLGFKRPQDCFRSYLVDDAPLVSLKGVQNRRKIQRELLANKKATSIENFACGMPFCKLKFLTEARRIEHRNACHPEMLFLDSYEQYEEYKQISNKVGGGLDEIIITDNGKIVGIDKCNAGQYDMKTVDYVDESTLSNVECEVVCSSSDNIPESDYGQFSSTLNLTEGSQLESQYFLNRIDEMLNQIRDHAEVVAQYPMRRHLFKTKINSLLNFCQESTQTFSLHNSAIEVTQSLFAKPSLVNMELEIGHSDAFLSNKQSSIVMESKVHNNYCRQIIGQKANHDVDDEIIVHYDDHSLRSFF